MAVQTKTFYPMPPMASFTATVATIVGSADAFPKIVGPSAKGTGYQAAYMLQSSGLYRWIEDENLDPSVSAPTAMAYVRTVGAANTND